MKNQKYGMRGQILKIQNETSEIENMKWEIKN